MGLPSQPASGRVVRAGHLKKLKTNRRKYFVLRDETPETLARLEYHDSEKKFRAGLPPKRSIALKTCFNINKRHDIKNKHVIALYTKTDCFCVALDGEEELQAWLKDMLVLQHGEEMPEGQPLRPKFEYVWQVVLCERGLGTGNSGIYRLCLSDKTLTLIKRDDPECFIEVDLATVRSCGVLKSYFYLEIGRSSSLGAGELWTEAPDYLIAYNIQTTVQHRFKMCHANKRAITVINDISPTTRIRSSSATETSKSKDAGKKQGKNKFFQGDTPEPIIENSPSSTVDSSEGVPQGSQLGAALPQEPAATNSTSSHSTVSGYALSLFSFVRINKKKRRHSISGIWARSACQQQQQQAKAATIAQVGRHEEAPAAPAAAADAPDAAVATPARVGAPAAAVLAKRPAHASKSFRERCVSMPSRPHTTSESHPSTTWGRPYLVPHRPHLQELSHGSPVGSPVSASDSTASSYNSLPDTNEHFSDGDTQKMHHSVPITPEEVIAEEEMTDFGSRRETSGYVPMGPGPILSNINQDYMPMGCPDNQQTTIDGYVPMTPGQPITVSDDGFTDMSPRDCNAPSNSASMSSVTSGTPSTDIRFSDYPLDKVSSYFSAEEEERPARAYSVGSRPPGILLRRLEMSGTPENYRNSNQADNSRVRAFSVGSKAKKIMRVLPPIHHNTIVTQPTNAKSNSAPLLASTPRTTSSHSSIGPMDDLMEMDFSSTSRPRTNTNSSSGYPACNHKNSTCVNNRTPVGYVEMKPGDVRTTPQSDEQPYVDMTQGQRNAGYVDMTVGNSNSPSIHLTGTSPVRSSLGSPQLDNIDWNRYYNRSGVQDGGHLELGRIRTSSVSSGNRSVTSPGFQWRHDYMDMSGSKKYNNLSSSPSIQSTSPQNSDYMPLNFGPNENCIPEVPTQTPEGYMEMTPGVSVAKHYRQSSLDSARVLNNNEDYLNMSGKKSEKKNVGRNKDKTKTQPITITATSTSPLSISSLLNRKNSSGTPPKMHLPLSTSTYSSLPRQKTKKNNPIVSPTSPVNKTTTPTALRIPAAILNVVYKPSTKKKEEDRDYTMMDFETTKQKEETSDYMNYCPAPANVKKAGNKIESIGDYAVMKPGIIDVTKMVGATGGSGSTSPLTTHLSQVALTETAQATCFRPINERDERLGVSSPRPGDHLPANMVEETKSIESANMDAAEESPYEKLRGSSDCVSPAAKISRPSSSNSDKIKTTSPRSFSSSEKLSRPPSVCSDTKLAVSRPGSTSSVHSSSSCSTIVGCSRPDSVNSDKVTQLHYASLDLAIGEDDVCSRSPRAVRMSSSDSSCQGQAEPTFVYAEIDFIASESLRSEETGGNANGSSSNVIR